MTQGGELLGELLGSQFRFILGHCSQGMKNQMMRSSGPFGRVLLLASGPPVLWGRYLARGCHTLTTPTTSRMPQTRPQPSAPPKGRAVGTSRCVVTPSSCPRLSHPRDWSRDLPNSPKSERENPINITKQTADPLRRGGIYLIIWGHP